MQILEHLPTLTLNPANAERLKQLVLELAVRGKLTENWRRENLDTEPSSTLLERIHEEKARLVKEKKIRKSKPLAPLDEDEMAYGLPITWSWSKLGELGDWGSGATPKRGETKFYGGNINWFKSGELNNEIMDYESEEKITDDALSKTSVRLNQPGDVLIAMYGATIGKTGILNVHGTTNQAVCACTCYDGFYNFYLHLVLKAYKPIFTNQGAGGAQPNISREKIINTAIPLPPLAEQQAIVSIVDQLMERIDALTEEAKERISTKRKLAQSALHHLTYRDAGLPQEDFTQRWHFVKQHFSLLFDDADNVQKLRESILQLAVQGKLTEHWRRENPGTEPASTLLQRIQEEKAGLIKEKKIKKEKPLPLIEADEIPYELPESWEWCRLGELGQFSGGGTPSKSVPQYWNGSILWISPKDMKSQSITESQDRITEEAVNNSSAKLIPVGSILIVSRSGILKRTVPVGINEVPCTVNQDLKVIIPYISEVNIFLMTLIKGLQNVILRDFVKYGMTVHSLKYKEFEEMVIPLPPLAEQQAIVSIVDQLMDLCDQLQAQATQATQQEEALMQALMHGVFVEGEREKSLEII